MLMSITTDVHVVYESLIGNTGNAAVAQVANYQDGSVAAAFFSKPSIHM